MFYKRKIEKLNKRIEDLEFELFKINNPFKFNVFEEVEYIFDENLKYIVVRREIEESLSQYDKVYTIVGKTNHDVIKCYEIALTKIK